MLCKFTLNKGIRVKVNKQIKKEAVQRIIFLLSHLKLITKQDQNNLGDQSTGKLDYRVSSSPRHAAMN